MISFTEYYYLHRKSLVCQLHWKRHHPIQLLLLMLWESLRAQALQDLTRWIVSERSKIFVANDFDESWGLAHFIIIFGPHVNLPPRIGYASVFNRFLISIHLFCREGDFRLVIYEHLSGHCTLLQVLWTEHYIFWVSLFCVKFLLV